MATYNSLDMRAPQCGDADTDIERPVLLNHKFDEIEFLAFVVAENP